MKQYEYIDALRGIAIMLVIAVHVGGSCSLTGLIASTVSYGAWGVQLFYVVSCVTLLLSMNSRNTLERRPTQNFFIRRIFRVAPLFHLFLLVYLCWLGVTPRYYAPHGVSASSVVMSMLFINGWRPDTINGIVPGQWSIAVEMTFYLVLPFLFLIVTSF